MGNNFAALCAICGKRRGEHSAGVLRCPSGSKTRIGYTDFSPTQTFTPKPEKRR